MNNPDPAQWQHDVADATGYLIPETGQIADAPTVIEAFRDRAMWERDAFERAQIAETKLTRIEALLNDESLGDHLYPEDVRRIIRGEA